MPVALALSSVLSILKGAAEGSPAWQIKEDRSAAAQSIGVTPASTPAASAGAAASNSPLLEWGLRLLEAVLHCNSMIDSSVPRSAAISALQPHESVQGTCLRSVWMSTSLIQQCKCSNVLCVSAPLHPCNAQLTYSAFRTWTGSTQDDMFR